MWASVISFYGESHEMSWMLIFAANSLLEQPYLLPEGSPHTPTHLTFLPSICSSQQTSTLCFASFFIYKAFLFRTTVELLEAFSCSCCRSALQWLASKGDVTEISNVDSSEVGCTTFVASARKRDACRDLRHVSYRRIQDNIIRKPCMLCQPGDGLVEGVVGEDITGIP